MGVVNLETIHFPANVLATSRCDPEEPRPCLNFLF
jgi:hypothetical protein